MVEFEEKPPLSVKNSADRFFRKRAGAASATLAFDMGCIHQARTRLRLAGTDRWKISQNWSVRLSRYLRDSRYSSADAALINDCDFPLSPCISPRSMFVRCFYPMKADHIFTIAGNDS